MSPVNKVVLGCLSGMLLLANVATAQSVQGVADLDADPGTCSAVVTVDDTLHFKPSVIEVPAECEQFTVLLRHMGRLPMVATPRNWVLTGATHADGVARDAELAGAANNWIKPGDERVLAASAVIGRGQTVRVDIPIDVLVPGKSYIYLSTIPGFSPVLRGTLTRLR